MERCGEAGTQRKQTAFFSLRHFDQKKERGQAHLPDCKCAPLNFDINLEV